MISKQEILKGKTLPKEYEQNFEVLYFKANLFRSFYGKPIIVSSGFRSEADQRRIYAAKGISNPPMGSNHLKALAVDFYDPKGELKEFVKANEQLMVMIGFWFEDFSATPNFCHLQIVPPKSGRFYFLP